MPDINKQFSLLEEHHENISIADAYNGFYENQADYIIEGDIHPTTEGQRILADVGIEVLKPYFEN